MNLVDALNKRMMATLQRRTKGVRKRPGQREKQHTPWLNERISLPSFCEIVLLAVKWNAAGSRRAITLTVKSEELSCDEPKIRGKKIEHGKLSHLIHDILTLSKALLRKLCSSRKETHP
jgi:hypothetical protein